MNLATQNYLVIGVVIAAFAVILPIFLRPYFSSPPANPNVSNQFSRPRRGERSGGGGPGKSHPAMDSMRDFHSMHGGRPHMGGPPHPGMNDMGGDKQGGGGGRGGIMSIALPIYSVGIVLYVLYVFYKFYTKGFSRPNDQNQKFASGCNSRASSGPAKPTVEQIQNYKQFLLAKEECARRIFEERELQSTGSSPKLTGDQLTQLEARLCEAEEAMEKAMVKMGLDVRQLKQDTGYQDPLAQSLEELKKTMATLSSNDPTVTFANIPSKDSGQTELNEEAVLSDNHKRLQMPQTSCLKKSESKELLVIVGFEQFNKIFESGKLECVSKSFNIYFLGNVRLCPSIRVQAIEFLTWKVFVVKF